MQKAVLNVIPRENGNRSTNRKLRREGFVPAHIYGPGFDNGSCSFSEKELRLAFKNDFESARIIELKSDDANLNGKKVILKDLERDPTSWKLVHADLYELSMERALKVMVPLKLEGIPEGVKTGGGILQVVRRAVEIKALPADIPEFISVDISALNIGDNIHVRDLKVSDKYTLLDLADYAIASVIEPQEEEEATPVVGAVVEGEEGAPAEGEAAAAPAEGAAPAAEGAAKPAEGGDKGAAKSGDKGSEKKK